MTTSIRQRLPLPPLPARDRDCVTVKSLHGELDLASSAALHAYLRDILPQPRPRCILDLTDLEFIDCACLGVLARHCTEIRARGGSFALAGPQALVRRILSVTGLLTWFEVHDTVEQATRAARKPVATVFARPGPPRSPGTQGEISPDRGTMALRHSTQLAAH